MFPNGCSEKAKFTSLITHLKFLHFACNLMLQLLLKHSYFVILYIDATRRRAAVTTSAAVQPQLKQRGTWM